MKTQRQLFFVFAAGLFLLFLMNSMQNPGGKGVADLAFSDFLTEVGNGRVAEVTIRDQEVLGTFDDGDKFPDEDRCNRKKQSGIRTFDDISNDPGHRVLSDVTVNLDELRLGSNVVATDDDEEDVEMAENRPPPFAR